MAGAGLGMMTGGDDSDSFVIDASALARLDLLDVVTDFAIGDVLDLSGLLDALLGTPGGADGVADIPADAGFALVAIDSSDAATVGTMVEVSPLAGVHNAISILYDDIQQSIDAV